MRFKLVVLLFQLGVLGFAFSDSGGIGWRLEADALPLLRPIALHLFDEQHLAALRVGAVIQADVREHVGFVPMRGFVVAGGRRAGQLVTIGITFRNFQRFTRGGSRANDRGPLAFLIKNFKFGFACDW